MQCISHLATHIQCLVLYGLRVEVRSYIGGDPNILHPDNNREPDYMLSFKQCTVLLFAGKLMWFFFRQLELKLKKLVRCFEGMKMTCFHATGEDVQPPPPTKSPVLRGFNTNGVF